jgi:hypothetical protein
MKPTNLNPLFIDQIINFAHLIKPEPQTKEQFLKTISEAYDTRNPKTELFYQATQRSDFETIQLNRNRDSILFNKVN